MSAEDPYRDRSGRSRAGVIDEAGDLSPEEEERVRVYDDEADAETSAETDEPEQPPTDGTDADTDQPETETGGDAGTGTGTSGDAPLAVDPEPDPDTGQQFGNGSGASAGASAGATGLEDRPERVSQLDQEYDFGDTTAQAYVQETTRELEEGGLRRDEYSIRFDEDEGLYAEVDEERYERRRRREIRRDFAAEQEDFSYEDVEVVGTTTEEGEPALQPRVREEAWVDWFDERIEARDITQDDLVFEEGTPRLKEGVRFQLEQDIVREIDEAVPQRDITRDEVYFGDEATRLKEGVQFQIEQDAVEAIDASVPDRDITRDEVYFGDEVIRLREGVRFQLERDPLAGARAEAASQRSAQREVAQAQTTDLQFVEPGGAVGMDEVRVIAPPEQSYQPSARGDDGFTPGGRGALGGRRGDQAAVEERRAAIRSAIQEGAEPFARGMIGTAAADRIEAAQDDTANYIESVDRRMREQVSPGRQFVGTEAQLDAAAELEAERYEEAVSGFEQLTEDPLGLTVEEVGGVVYQTGEAIEIAGQDLGRAAADVTPFERVPVIGEPAERAFVEGIPATAGMFAGTVVRGSVTVTEGVNQIISGDATWRELGETTATSTRTGGERQAEYFREHPVEAALLAAPLAVPSARGFSRGVVEGGTGRTAGAARTTGRAAGRISPTGSRIATEAAGAPLRAGRTAVDVAARAPRPSVQRFQVGEAAGVTAGLRRRTGKVEEFTEGVTVARGLEGPAIQRRPRVSERAIPEEGIAADLTAAETRAVQRTIGAESPEAIRTEAFRNVQRETQYSRVEPRELRSTVEEVLVEQGVPEAAAPEILRTVRGEGGQIYGSITQRAAGREVGEPGLARVPRDIDIGGVESSTQFAQRVAERMNRAANERVVDVEGSTVRSRRTGEELFDIHEAEAPQSGYSRIFEPERGTFGVRSEAPIRSREGVETTTLSEQTARKGAGSMEVITAEPRTVGELTSRVTPTHPGRLKDIADFYIGERANIEGLRQRGRSRRAARAEESLDRFVETYDPELARSIREQYRSAAESGEITTRMEIADFGRDISISSPFASPAATSGVGSTFAGRSPGVNVQESPVPSPYRRRSGAPRDRTSPSPIDPDRLDSEFQSRFTDIDSKASGSTPPLDVDIPPSRPPRTPDDTSSIPRYTTPPYSPPPGTPSDPPRWPSVPITPPSTPSTPSPPYSPPSTTTVPPYSPPPPGTPSDPPLSTPPRLYAPGGDDEEFRPRFGFEEEAEVTGTGILSIEEVQAQSSAQFRELERQLEDL